MGWKKSEEILFVNSLLVFVVASWSEPSPPKVLVVRLANKIPLENIESQRTLTLECSADGNPTPSLRWSINGTKSIPTDGQDVRFEDNNARLIVYQVQRSRDSGVYRCVAENLLGAVFGELLVEIGVAGQFAAGSRIFDPERTITVVEGAKAVISCPEHKEGTGGELYLWGDYPLRKPPIFLTPGDSSPRAFIDNNGSLVFSYIADEDIDMLKQMKGISCILYQAAVPVQSVKINVEKVGTSAKLFPPGMVKFMKPKMTAVIDEEYSMDCGASGRPLPEINWFKNGIKIEENSKFRFGRSQKLRLTISKVNEDDKGIYRCVANNSQGTAIKEGRLEIHTPPAFEQPGLPDISTLPLWERFSLECRTTGNPKPTIQWYHNNSVLEERSGVVISEEKIQFSALEFSDSGMYLCVARNYLKVVVSAAYVQVQAIQPSFLRPLADPTYLFKRQDNLLVCNVSGAPVPTRTWYRENQMVQVGDGGDVSAFATTDGALAFKNSSVYQEGRYKCVAENVKGAAQSEAQIRVVEKTVIFKPPAYLVYREKHASASFFCDAVYDEGSLDVVFQWLKDGQEIISTKSVYLEKRIFGPSRILYLQDLQVDYAGVYTCRVYTKEKSSPRIVSEDKKSGSLVIIAAPEPASDLQLSGDCDSFDATLAWEPAVPVGVDVSYYLIEYASYESAEANKWFLYNPDNPRVAAPTHSVQLRKGLIAPGADLMFRVKAVAKIGEEELTSKESQETAIGLCATPPTAPIMNPVNVSVVDPLYPGELAIKWDKILRIHQGAPGFYYIVGYRRRSDPVMTNVTIVDADLVHFKVPNPGYFEEYELFVRSANDEGLGPEPKSLYAFSGRNKPWQAPTNVRVKEVRASSVELAWNEVDDANKYRAYVWESALNFRQRRDAPKFVRHQDLDGQVGDNVTGLLPRTRYKITVAAVNNGGVGPQSQKVEASTLDGVPASPVDVQLTVLADKLRLRWSPAYPGYGSVGGYKLSWYKTGSPADHRDILTLPNTAREAFLSNNLEHMTYYNVELAAFNGLGASDPWSSARVVVGHPDKPGKPLAPLVQGISNSSVNVTFRLADDYYGGLPSKIVVYYRLSGDKALLMETERRYPSYTWAVVEGLLVQNYDFWLVAVNDQGSSDRSPISTGSPLISTLIETTSLPRVAAEPFYSSSWFLIVIVCVVLLTALAVIVYLVLQRRGGKYPGGGKPADADARSVGKREKSRVDGQPLTDYANKPHDDFPCRPYRSSKETAIPANPNSHLSPHRDQDDDADGDSLDDYAEDATFDDNASFIGQYGEEKKKNGCPTAV